MRKILKVLAGVTAGIVALGYLVPFAMNRGTGAERGKLKAAAEARQAFVTRMSDWAFPKGESGLEVSTGGESDSTLEFKMTFGNDLAHVAEITEAQNETFNDMARIMMEPDSKRGLCDLGFTSLSYEGSLPTKSNPQIFNLNCGLKK